MKRQRGRGRRPGGGGGGGHHQHNNNPNRPMESNGPETKVRGPVSHIHERYLQLARDAASSGDRVLSENYLQHADHYFRLWRSMQPAVPIQQQERFSAEGADYEGDDEARSDAAEAADEGDVRSEGEEQPDADAAQAERRHDRDRDGDQRRRGRGRRNRFRPEGGERDGYEERAEGGAEPDEAAAPREPRFERRPRDENEPREERRERRPPRDRDSERESAEGFSNGPKPAFLRGGD